MATASRHVDFEDPKPEIASIDALMPRIAALVPILKQRAWQTEQERRVSSDIIDLIRATGVFRLMQPKRFGGLELGFDDFVRLNFELGRGCGSTAWCVAIAILHSWLVGLYPLATQEEVWSDPDALITGAYAPTGTAEPVDGGYRLSGAWSFASNCDNSAWFVVCAPVAPASGEGRPQQIWFLVPASDARIEDSWYSAGMAGTGSKTIVIDQPVFVPARRALSVVAINSGEAPGTLTSSNPLYALSFTGAAPFTLASVPIGIARGALEDFVEMARTKLATMPGGPPVPMAQLQQVQLAVADATATIDAIGLLMLRDTDAMRAMLDDGDLPAIAVRIGHRLNHAFVAREAARAVTGLFEVLGANGGALATPVQRAWRDVNVIARHASLGWHTTGAMYGQYALGQAPRGTY